MADGGDEEMGLYDNSDDEFGEEIVEQMDDNNEEEMNEEQPEQTSTSKGKKKKKKKKKKKAKETSADNDDDNEEDVGSQEKEVFLPGDKMEDDEELTYDSSAYKMYHAAQTGSPCLSFDVVPDILGESRTEFPMTAYIVAGTQAPLGQQNHVIVMKMSELHQTENEDTADSDDEYIEEEPDLETSMIKHTGGVNRIRHAHIPDRHIVATWSDKNKVYIWDVSPQVISVDNPTNTTQAKDVSPLYTFAGHLTEGFSMDWSRTVPGRLLTGDCKHNIHLWSPQEGGSWHVDQRPFNAHTDSVEDLQWSPNEKNVFASCSVDQTVRIWDARAAPSKACMLTTKAHDADVNVISWNRSEPFIVSGGDDGILKIWDLRQFQKGEPVALFKHNTGPITSVEWHPTDSSVFAASSEDNQVTLWDLAVERDETVEGPGRHLDVPPQLLFIHMGQKSVKEIHWHQQLPGVVISTAASGFNVFKTISV